MSTVTFENVCRAHTKRQVIIEMNRFNMFITAVCVLFWKLIIYAKLLAGLKEKTTMCDAQGVNSKTLAYLAVVVQR